MAAANLRIIVHGGAGSCPPERHAAARSGCRAAALRGWQILQSGGSALDAVEAAVIELEDNPEFNAGTGAVLNARGEVQLDASIMDGASLRAGAVANVREVRNPIRLARQVLIDGRHVLLVSAGAEQLAAERGIPRCANSELVTPRQQKRWQERHGTVGCVARDAHGHVAAATSTGGRAGALPGRVGDSPLIGCGTYADASGGASCTGVGEDIMRLVLAKTALVGLAAGTAAADAARGAIDQFERHTGSQAGIILIGADGRIGHAHNAETMAVAFIGADGRCQTAL